MPDLKTYADPREPLDFRYTILKRAHAKIPPNAEHGTLYFNSTECRIMVVIQQPMPEQDANASHRFIYSPLQRIAEPFEVDLFLASVQIRVCHQEGEYLPCP